MPGAGNRLRVVRIVGEGDDHPEGPVHVIGGHDVGLAGGPGDVLTLRFGVGGVDALPLVGEDGVRHAVGVFDVRGGGRECLADLGRAVDLGLARRHVVDRLLRGRAFDGEGLAAGELGPVWGADGAPGLAVGDGGLLHDDDVGVARRVDRDPPPLAGAPLDARHPVDGPLRHLEDVVADGAEAEAPGGLLVEAQLEGEGGLPVVGVGMIEEVGDQALPLALGGGAVIPLRLLIPLFFYGRRDDVLVAGDGLQGAAVVGEGDDDPDRLALIVGGEGVGLPGGAGDVDGVLVARRRTRRASTGR